MKSVRAIGVLSLSFCALSITACQQAKDPVAAVTAPMDRPARTASGDKEVRITGLVQAQQSYSVRVPQISTQNSRVTLVKLIPNGTRVQKDAILAEFDRTTLLDNEREAQAKLDDLNSQLDEKRAQIKSDAETRMSKLREAEAQYEKARIELKKGPILAEIDRLKNQETERSTKLQVESLKKSDALRRSAEAAAVRVLELKADRQKVSLERIRASMDKLVVRSPQDGMVAMEVVWRSGSMGPPQEGDQLWPGQPVMRVFNPQRMVVEAQVNEPDIAALSEGARAKVYLDAYPGAIFDADLESASPVATAALESPVRTFAARFIVEQVDPRLLPDLSASLEIVRPAVTAAPQGKEPVKRAAR